MGKLAKLLLLLAFLLAICFPPAAVKVRDAVKKQGEELDSLSTEVKDAKGKLQKAEEDNEALQENLDAEKSKTDELKRKLDSTTQQLDAVKVELRDKEGELNRCVIANKKLEEDIKKLEEEKAALEETVSKRLQELEKIAKTAETAPDVPEEDETKALRGRGRIAGIYGDRFLTISLGSKIGDVKSPLFVHRKTKVLGKVRLKKVHGATIVIEAKESELLESISEGDVVELEANGELLDTEVFEGRVSTVSRHNFVSIDVPKPVQMIPEPVFVLYRGNDVVGTIQSTRIISLVIVAELSGIKRGLTIAPKDYLRTPR